MNTPKVETLEYHDIVYKLLFASLFRPLSPSESAELSESVFAVGIGHPVLVYDSEAHGPNCVIDGANRLRIAAKLNVDCPVKELEIDDETACQMAEDLNIARRQVAFDEALAVRQTRQQRQQRIKEALKKNPARSDNAIAEELNVSDKTVASIRAKLEATSEIPKLDVRTGKDNRQRKARSDSPKPKPPTGDTTTLPKPKPVKNCAYAQNPVPSNGTEDGEANEPEPPPARSASLKNRPKPPHERDPRGEFMRVSAEMLVLLDTPTIRAFLFASKQGEFSTHDFKQWLKAARDLLDGQKKGPT